MVGARSGACVGLAGALLALALVGAGGCATTRLDTEWSEGLRGGPGFRTWFVLAAVRDPVRRRLWEDAFTRALSDRGVSATPSYRLFPQDFPDTSEAREKLREGGFDGLLVVRRGAEDERVVHRSGSGVGVGGTFVPFWGVYVDVFHRLGRGGGASAERVVRWDVEVYDGDDARLVWAGRSPMTGAAVDERLTRDVTDTVIPRLRRARLLR